MSTLEDTPIGSSAARGGLDVRRLDASGTYTGTRAIRGWLGRVGSSGSSLEWLLGGFDTHGRLLGAALMVPQPGRTGLVFPAPPGRRGVEPLTHVLRACLRRVPRDRVHLAQALLGAEERRACEALRAAGFQRLTTLAYMQAQIAGRTAEPPPPAGVEFRAYEAAMHPLMVEAVEATYRESLDCSALRGYRDTEDILRGHRAVGVFEARLWTLALIDGRPAGVALLNRVPSAACVELVYLGVAAEHRGRGLGAVMLQRAIAQCARMGESHLTLAVDTDNTPALALYRRAGFSRTAVREAMVYPIGPGCCGTDTIPPA